MRKFALLAGVAVLMVLMFGAGWLVAKTGVGAGADRASLTDMERAFADRMQNSSLVGYFTLDGREGGGRPDRYDIASVTKVDNGRWRFDVRMRHSTVDITVPVAVPVSWVGDTPMIDMTDLELPGVGTFTTRVFFYGDRYAGTWQNAKVGGHMYGKIEKQQK